jgi:molybdenum cofactor guanylyltransferase
MGRDKAMVEFEGRPLIEHAIDLLQGAGLTVSVAGGAVHHLEKLAPTVEDVGSSQGPLGGICGALKATPGSWAVFIPVDLPMLPASLLSTLQRIAQITGDPIVVPSVNGFAQTFPAVVHRNTLPALNAELQSGRRGCFAAFQAAANSLGKSIRVVAAELLVQTGQVKHSRGLPAVRWFFNINSPSDLALAHSFSRRTSPEQSHFA